jgi:hypothetical protein
MKMMKVISSCLLVVAFLFTSCEDLLEPSPDNQRDIDFILEGARFGEGLLLNAYSNLPNVYPFDEAATDDAVSNLLGAGFKRMATGEWSSQFNPVSVWNDHYQTILYINLFLDLVDDVEWSWESAERNEMFAERFTGEAYGLRALYYTELLRAHGGLGSDNEMLGFILLDEYVEPAILDPNLPRSGFDECVQFIVDDCDRAIAILPMDYVEQTETNEQFVWGEQNKNRITARHAMAIKARVLLMAASPAFNTAGTASKWEDAADAAAELLTEIGGVAGLSPTGLRWYLNQNDPEIIWRKDVENILTWESQNFPPSMFGSGRNNPTQNFVDAFPMNDGTPIAESGAYDPSNPYANRDPRLAAYVVYNGNTIGTNVINTNVEDITNGLNKTELSTVTGYYLKKLMNEAVRLNPGSQNSRVHFYTLFRYTEMFLNYAEAANEAWGPDGDPEGYGFTARDVIGAIRERAGIIQPDAYLATVTTKEDMRDLIRNERRIELSFEGFRFWDIRRWDLPLNETAKGMSIEGGVHTVIDVEVRDYDAHMKYGPIPYRETLINTSLVQNKDW